MTLDSIWEFRHDMSHWGKAFFIPTSDNQVLGKLSKSLGQWDVIFGPLLILKGNFHWKTTFTLSHETWHAALNTWTIFTLAFGHLMKTNDLYHTKVRVLTNYVNGWYSEQNWACPSDKCLTCTVWNVLSVLWMSQKWKIMRKWIFGQENVVTHWYVVLTDR